MIGHETSVLFCNKFYNNFVIQEFFKDLEEWGQFLAQIKRVGHYEGMMLHGPHFDHLAKRLESVTVCSAFRLNRLEYTQMRYVNEVYVTILKT